MRALAPPPPWPVTTIFWPTVSVAAAWVMVVDVPPAAATLCEMARAAIVDNVSAVLPDVRPA